MEDVSDKKFREESSSEHPIWSYSGLSDRDLKDILSNPENDQFVSLAARLLESSLNVDRVFEYLDPEIFARNFDIIKKSMGESDQALKHNRFWSRMAEQGKKKLDIEDEEKSGSQKSSDSVASESAERIGQRIRKIRKREGVSQVELADRLNVSRQVISRLENGKHNPSYKKINRVLNALGYKPNLEVLPLNHKKEK